MVRFVRMAAFLILSFAVFMGSEALADRGQHEVTASVLYFREEADASSRSLASLEQGTVVTVLSEDDGWAKARWDGRTGYLSTDYIEKITDPCAEGRNTTRLSGSAWTETGAGLYFAADDTSEVLTRLEAGEGLTLKGETLNYYYVSVGGEAGYVLKDCVTRNAPQEQEEEEKPSLLKEGDSGDAVREMQDRLCDLGYLEEDSVTGCFGPITRQAVRRFQMQAGLSMDGVAGPATQEKLFSGSAPKKRDIIEMDWYETNIHYMVDRNGGTATIIDCATGIRIDIRRVGGISHMDVEPKDADDTEKLLRIYGGSWSWDRRAVILVTGGKYIAASINGMPHGREISTTNEYDGQFCLHTTNSRTHGTDRVDDDHQDCIEEALDFLS